VVGGIAGVDDGDDDALAGAGLPAGGDVVVGVDPCRLVVGVRAGVLQVPAVLPPVGVGDRPAATGTTGEYSASATPGSASRWCGATPLVATRARSAPTGWALTTPSARATVRTRAAGATPSSAVST
jgi:hypothetical protein